MNPKWAEENLQTIRTLMERSALYRRALAPVMISVGAVGIIGGIVGWQMKINSSRGFVFFWSIVAAVALVGAFLLIRRQAIKDQENLWSPPTRRVAQAMSPPLTAGLALGVALSFTSAGGAVDFTLMLPFLWALFYGCALHSAGSFMPRGVKWFGWFFIGLASSILCFLLTKNPDIELNANWLMGGFFGGLHLAYGIYLYFTEKKNPAA